MIVPCSLLSLHIYRRHYCHTTHHLHTQKAYYTIMYFRNVVCTVALATLASAAVAKQIPTPYSTNEAYEDGLGDEVFEREAEAARTAAWEQAHGGAAPSYHYGEEHDAAAWHIARDAEAEPGSKNGAWLAHLKSEATQATDVVKNAVPTAKPFTKQSGGLKKHHGGHKSHGNHGKHGKHTRDVEAEEDEEFASDPDDPEFYLDARGLDDEEEGEEEPLNPDLTGYDEEVLQRRADGTAEDVDYSLEGYDDVEDDEDLSPIVQARSLNEYNEYDDYLRSEEHRSLLESISVTKRDVEDDEQDEEFDQSLYDAENPSDDAEDYETLSARDVVDDDVPEYDVDEEDTFLDDLEERDIDQEEFDIPEGVDYSLDGLQDGPIFARDADDEELEDDDGVDDYADAAYDGAEVVEELVAPVLG